MQSHRETLQMPGNLRRRWGFHKPTVHTKHYSPIRTIQAVYIPLPNHLHVEWAIKSLQAGKHVLCEKPIAMTFKEAEYLQIQAKKFSRLKLMEAFMYRHHPQILKAKELIKHGTIGNLRNIHTMFSYYNDNPKDIRNNPDIGGGGLLDIGCYCISLSRFLFDDEPKRVCAIVEYDPTLKVDRLASAILEFEEGVSTITCSTSLLTINMRKFLALRGGLRSRDHLHRTPANNQGSSNSLGRTNEKLSLMHAINIPYKEICFRCR